MTSISPKLFNLKLFIFWIITFYECFFLMEHPLGAYLCGLRITDWWRLFWTFIVFSCHHYDFFSFAYFLTSTSAPCLLEVASFVSPTIFLTFSYNNEEKFTEKARGKAVEFVTNSWMMVKLMLLVPDFAWFDFVSYYFDCCYHRFLFK